MQPVQDSAVRPSSAPDVVLADDLALQRAAIDGSLELLYQPEVDLADGAIVGMEGLLRWHHGDLGMMVPGDFLGAAEDIGSIADWVLATGATEAASWARLSSGGVPLWLNVGAAQLRSADLVDRIVFELAGHGLATGRLGLELSQTVLDDLGRAAGPILTDLRRAGVLLAVDHVTTWSQLLESLPLTGVKLDVTRVRDEDATGACAVLEAAHARGLYVVAEGVETRSVATRLADLGCDRAYGWMFSSPQRADKARWLAGHPAAWRGDVLTMSVPRA